MTTKSATIASFIQAAPPGELQNVVADVKVLAPNETSSSLEGAFKKYNEEQYATVKVPNGNQTVLLSEYNAVEGSANRYIDPASQTSFQVDHASQTASNSESHSLDTPHSDLLQSLQTAFSQSSAEHFPSSTIGIYPTASTIAIVLVANKYSPQNYWNGRWRSTYQLSPSSSALSGEIKVDVHYYEDGNVRMSTSKKVQEANVSGGAEAVVRSIVKTENKFQEDLNRGFTALAEGSFKGLRRQLPVTRQRVEWEKIGGYRLGQDIGGGRSR